MNSNGYPKIPQKHPYADVEYIEIIIIHFNNGNFRIRKLILMQYQKKKKKFPYHG